MRTYTRKTTMGTFEETAMREAVELVRQGMSLRKAGKAKAVAHQTLARYVKKQEQHPGKEIRMRPNYECRMFFDAEQEKAIADYLVASSNMFYGITTKECRRLAYEMCVVNSIACPTKWADEMAAGIYWYNGFMKRHPRLSLRTPEGCSLAKQNHAILIMSCNSTTILKSLCKGSHSLGMELASSTLMRPAQLQSTFLRKWSQKKA